MFAVQGFSYASWAVRVPAVKEQVSASAAALGLALLGLSAGAVATMLLAGALCRRFGSRQTTAVSCVLLSLTVVLPALARSAIALGLLLAVFGAAYGSLNVAMNTVAVDMVAALRRPVMPGFHAAWSFGGLAGAGLGALLAPHLSPLRHLSLIALICLLLAVVTGRTLLRHTIATSAGPAPAPSPPPASLAASPPPASPVPAIRPATGDRPPPGTHLTPGDRPAPAAGPVSAWRNAWRTSRVVGLFGLIALCAAYGEGAIGDWAPCTSGRIWAPAPVWPLWATRPSPWPKQPAGYPARPCSCGSAGRRCSCWAAWLRAQACSSPHWPLTCGWLWPDSP